MTPEEREAVRALIAALPKCEAYLPGFDNDQCRQPATRYQDAHCRDCGEREHYCDEHGAFLTDDLDYAEPLRKLQAMLSPEEKPGGGFVASDVVDALGQDGLRAATFTHDTRGSRMVEVNLGPHLGTYRIPIDGTETTVELAEKVRAVLPKEWGAVTSVAPKR